jgi:hypothetical protein
MAGKIGGVISQRRIRLTLATGAFVWYGWYGVACSSPEKLGGLGDSCLLFTDCAPNLVCAPTSGSQMECLDDASALVKTEEAGASPEGSAVARSDAAALAGDGASPQSVDEASLPATDGATPQDSAPPVGGEP